MSVLKRSVFVGLVLFALIPLNDAACSIMMLKRGATHCQDIMDKIWHPVGSSWTNGKCVKCTCKADGMRCCDGLPKIFNVPEDCTVEYNYKTCTFKVSEKKNPSIPCSHSAVGK